jgi:NAD(P)-dependent dehydrogenase (short-subunit alcohol dehydrogenase family)
MSNQFQGKVVLVAGGTGGLGRAISLAFLGEGARVLVPFRDQSQFTLLREQAGPLSSMLEGRTADVTDTGEMEALVEEISQKWGQLDILVNAVGGYAGGIKLWDLDGKTLEQMLALNLQSVFALSRAAAPGMIERKKGAMVHVLSKAAVDHAAGAAAYASTKAAALAMVDSLAADLKGSGVRVNAILPSIIDTSANRKAMPQADFSKWPKPEEIARVVLFLCSDDARVIHGAALPVYGES